MKYNGTSDFEHGLAPRTGILLTNLGTPDAPARGPLRSYLKQFLSDPRVVELPRLLWWFILNLVILNVRPARSAASYRTVWTERGSPLMFHTQDQANALQRSLQEEYGESVVVEFAMRYGSHSIAEGIEALWQRGARRLMVLPLYPQYSGPTTASTFDALAEDFRQRRWLPELRFLTSYHDHPAYIKALADSILEHWAQHGRSEKLIFSYHGEPQRYLEQGDPYHCQCLKTTRLVAETLELDEADYLCTFQSRFGREPWLQPYTDDTLKQLARSGCRSVQLICPGFSADCLETIEEIGVENRDYFLEHGGKDYQYIPCLNAGDSHIAMMQRLIQEQLGDWLENPGNEPAKREMALGKGAKN